MRIRSFLHPFFLALAASFCALWLAACQTVPAPSATPAAVHGLSAEQLAALRREGFQETPEGWEFGMSDKILFGLDADRLTDDARQAVLRIGRVLRAVDIARLRVEGHTDSSGARDYNERLSQRRAAAVAQALEGAGFRPQDVDVVGRGAARPVADNASNAGRAENRRVAIIVPVP